MSLTLTLEGISVRFGATIALDRVGFTARGGEVLALVGENGSGKSTISKVIAGSVAPNEGTLTLNGLSYRPTSPAHARDHGVAMIHQELALCSHMTVLENIVLGAEKRITRIQAQEALTRLGYGTLALDKPISELPPASRQIVEIARAVASDAQVIIFDEPTSSLTAADAAHLFEVVESLRDSGHAILYISHFLEEVERLADHIVVLRDGNLVADEAGKSLTREQMVTLMVGREIAELYPRHPHTPGEALLSVRAVSGVKKPLGASLELRRGEVFGIAGLNGAGRTELVRILFGLDALAEGDITFASYSGASGPPMRWKQGMGMLSEDRKEEGLALSMSIAENATLASLGRGIIHRKGLEDASQKWIEALDIRCREAGQAIGELSGGNQQKVALARLLHRDVDCLLLDEPTRGIDVGSKRLIYEIIDQAALSGKAVLVVSSYLPELLGICDRIAVMRRGTLGEAHEVATTDATALLAEALGMQEEAV